MTPTRWVCLVVFLFAASMEAGMLYGISKASGTVAIYRMDPATGATALVADTGSSTYFVTTTALDPISRRYFFLGTSPNGLLHYIYAVDIDTGVFTTAPASSLVDWKWDPVSAKLVGLFTTDGLPSGNLGVYSMDPDTGVRTLLVATTINNYDFTGRAAFDPIGRRYFVLTPSGLYTINLLTSVVTQADPSRVFVELQYDQTSGRLVSTYGVINDEVDSMDPATGVANTVVVTDAQGIYLYDTAFDQPGRRFFFGAASGDIYTVDVATGAFTHVAGILAELEYAPSAAVSQPVPLFSNLTLALLAACLAFLGVIVTLRR